MTTFRQTLKPRFAALGVIVLLVLGVLLVRLWTHAGALRRSVRRAGRGQPRPRGHASTRRAAGSSTARAAPLVTNRPTLAVSSSPTVARGRRRAARRGSRPLLDMPVAEIQERLVERQAGARSRRASSRSTCRWQTVAYLAEHETRVPRRRGRGARRCASTRKGTLAAHVLGYTGEISETELDDRRARRLRARRHRGQGRRRGQFESVLQGDRATGARGRRRRAGRAGRPRRGEPRRRPRRRAHDRQRRAEGRREGARARRSTRRTARDYHKASAGAAVALDVQDRRGPRHGEPPDVRPRAVPRRHLAEGLEAR